MLLAEVFLLTDNANAFIMLLSMKKIPIILFISILISLGSFIILEVLDNTIISRVEIDFELPLPEEIARNYGISLYPSVEKVILTGFFSDWDEADENYLMSPQNNDPKNQKWSIETVLPPGEHQYKFAIYLKDRNEPIWSHDLDSYKQIFNGMESLNSLVKVKSYKNITTLLLNITYILLIITVPYLFYIFSFRSGIKQFLVLLILLIIISNMFFSLTYLFYNRLNYTFTSKSIISILQNDFERNSEDEVVVGGIYVTFNYFLWHKMDKIGIRNLEDKFRTVSLQYFDKNFNIVDSDYRNLNNVREYTPSHVPLFNYQIQKLKENSVNILNYKLPVFEKIYNKNHLNAKNTYIYPLIIDNKIDGYIGICFSENLVELFNFYMKFNIGAILLFLAIIFIFTMLRKQPTQDDDTLLKIFVEKYGITNRESDIITYLLEGLSNREIGEHLNISKRTVDNHIYNSLHKASAKNRVELINIIKNGL